MTDIWILYASIAAWLGIGCYAAFLACAQRKLARKLSLLEDADDQNS